MRNAVTFYSDFNSAARKDILTGEVPYKRLAGPAPGPRRHFCWIHQAYAPRCRPCTLMR